MKKLITIAISAASFLFIFALNINAVSAQTMKAGAATIKIPDEVLKVAGKSCVNCHKEPGNSMALSHVNLSKWESYTPEKQASKSQAMCNMVTKGKMPPKKFRKQHPDALPTKEDIKIICDWAQSLQTVKK